MFLLLSLNIQTGNDQRESVEPASTQSPPLQNITMPGSGGQPTITAPLNGTCTVLCYDATHFVCMCVHV